MRFPESELLFDNEWVQLRKANGYYIFSHEIRCNGNIIVIVPFRKNKNGDINILARVEATPCWDNLTPMRCSLTGGVDDGEQPLETAIKELQEEIGYIVEKSDVISLGTFYGTKSTDSIYHIFAVEITENTKKGDTTDKDAGGEWITLKDVTMVADPFLVAAVSRLNQKLLIPEYCSKCLAAICVNDPDPDDWFNDDDKAILCSLMPPRDDQFLSQAGIKFNHALVLSALRPTEFNTFKRPNWCPLNIDFK